MKKQETRRAVIREWMGLSRDKRQTEEQTTSFVKKAADLRRRDAHTTCFPGGRFWRKADVGRLGTTDGKDKPERKTRYSGGLTCREMKPQRCQERQPPPL